MPVRVLLWSRCGADTSISAQIICAWMQNVWRECILLVRADAVLMCPFQPRSSVPMCMYPECVEKVYVSRVDVILTSISAQIICADVVVHGCKIRVDGKLLVGFNFNV